MSVGLRACVALALSASLMSEAAAQPSVPPMSTLRVVHTATLLPNGKVLVTGGSRGNVVLAESELYDPATNAWSPAASLTPARERHTATLLSSGKVLVLGGSAQDSRFLRDADVYDPLTDSWAPSASGLPLARVLHSATLLANGKVLVVGGIDAGDQTLASTELYDPTTGRWTPAASLVTGRQRHTATLLADGKVLVLGGDDRNQDLVGNGELYDPATDSWSAAGRLAVLRQRHAATLLPNGTVFVAGGLNYFGALANGTALASVEIYDPMAGTSSMLASLTTARLRPTATLLPNGFVLITGGFDQNGHYLDTAELYAVPTTAVELVEYLNRSLDHYFITWVTNEIAILDAGTATRGWQRTGHTFKTYPTAQPASSPVCRYYLPPLYGDSHFFGRGIAECDATGRNNPGFVLEDPAFMHMLLPVNGSCPTATKPVYRVFSNRADANHRYTTDRGVRDQMVASGWLAEGDGADLVVMCAPQ